MSNLSEQRRASADQALTSYNFKRFIEDVSDWDQDGNVWTIMIYFANETNSYFSVHFIPETSDVAEVNEYPLDVSKQ